jgi:broad specificity phosphatase PhoE
VRVSLLAHGVTVAVRRAAFPADEPLDDPSAVAGVDLPRVDEVRCAASVRCRATAEALGLEAVDDPAPAGCDYGSWTGHSLDEVAAGEPAGLQQWLTDPRSTPHGGESLHDACARIGQWLDELPDLRLGLLAIVDPAVVQAAIVHAMGAPPTAIWRLDVAPLTTALLVGRPGRWNLRALTPAPR